MSPDHDYRPGWMTPAPRLLDPLWRVSVFRRWDGRFVITVNVPPQPDGTTRKSVLL